MHSSSAGRVLGRTLALGLCAAHGYPVLAALPAGQFPATLLASVALSASGRPPAAQVDAANRAALQEPRAESFIDAVQVYAWREGAVYRLYTAPERVTDIALQPGESLVAVAAGETSRWIVGDTTSGSGSERRVHILIKPATAGIATNFVITTDRRVYRLQATSTSRTAMAAVSWTYPQGELVALEQEAGGSAAAAAHSVDLANLRFGYTISGDDPPWRPVRAFDDGRQVFIEFPPGIAQGEAPPLFVVGPEGRSELVNYRIRGHFYVVDRLFAAAELRLGGRRQQVVRIRRGEVENRRRSSRRAR